MADIRDRGSPPGQRRSGGGTVVSGEQTDLVQEFGNPQYAGYGPAESVLQNSDDFIGELFQGAHFRSFTVPETAPVGGTITVSGVVHLDNPGRVISGQDIRVRVESPALNSPEIQEFQQVKHCQTRSFSVDIPAPQQESRVAVTIKAQQKTAVGWQTGELVGPERVDVVPSDEFAVQEGLGLVPYAAVGGGAGLLYGRRTGRGSQMGVAGAALGAGVGYAASKGNFSAPDIPLWGIAAAGVGVAALFSVTGLGEVTRPAAEQVGEGIRDIRSNTAPTRY